MVAKTKQAPPDGAGVIDLDARKAARLEASGPKQVRFGGSVWTFKAEMPMQVAEDFDRGDVNAAFGQLLADPADAKPFLASADLSKEDFADLLRLVYGMELPNS